MPTDCNGLIESEEQSSFCGELGCERNMHRHETNNLKAGCAGSGGSKLQHMTTCAAGGCGSTLQHAALQGTSATKKRRRTKRAASAPAVLSDQRSRVPSGGCELPIFETATWIRTTVHCGQCKVLGNSYFRKGLAVPGWARYDGDEVKDVLVGAMPDKRECKCHSLYSKADVQGGTVDISPYGAQKGYRPRDFYFVHALRAPSVGEAPTSWFSWHQTQWRANVLDRIRGWFQPLAARGRAREVSIQVSVASSNASISRVHVGPSPAGPVVTVKATAPPSYKDVVPTAGPSQKEARKAKPGQTVRCEGAPRNAAILHLGDHSITGPGVAAGPTILGANVAQNVLRWLSERLPADSSLVVSSDAGKKWGFSAELVSPDTQAEDRVATVADTFTYWDKNTTNPFHVISEGGRTLGELSDVDATSVITDGNKIDVNKVANLISGISELNQTIGKAVAPVFSMQKLRVDNTSLYAKGAYLMLLRQVIIEGHADYVPAWLAPGAALVLRVWSDAGLAEAFKEDIMARRFIVDVTHYTVQEISCLAHIARAGLMMHRGAAGSENPIGAGISWFAVDFALYRHKPWPAGYSITDFTPAEMHATLHRLASSRREMAQLTMGFVRASSLVHTTRHVTSSGTEVFLSSMGESMVSMSWLKPSAHNWLWDLMGFTPAAVEETIPEQEMAVLSKLGGRDLFKCSVALGGLFALGTGLAFNRMNITGLCLNAMSQPTVTIGSLSSFLRGMLRPAEASGVAAIYACMQAEVANVTPVTFSVKMFAGPGWSGGLRNCAARADTTWWAGVWGFRVPYPIKAFALSAFLTSWPDLFGVFAGIVSADLAADVIKAGDAAGWYASRGDGSYSAISMGQKGCFRYIPYGLACINAFMQTAGRVALYPLQVQRFAASVAGQALSPATSAGDALQADDWVPAIRTLVPGVIRTYDYQTNQVIAPVIPAGSFAAPQRQWVLKNMYKSAMVKTGLMLPESQAYVMSPGDEFDFGAIYGALPPTKDEVAGSGVDGALTEN